MAGPASLDVHPRFLVEEVRRLAMEGPLLIVEHARPMTAGSALMDERVRPIPWVRSPPFFPPPTFLCRRQLRVPERLP